MKKVLFIFIMLIQISMFSQETKKDSLWHKGGVSTLSFSQASLSNWAAGGENSISFTAFLNLYANYKNGNTIWENKIDMAYGLQKQGETSAAKSEDKLEFSSTYGQKAFKNFYYTTTLSFKSQFTNGYRNPEDTEVISSFLAPAYIMLSANLDYKPNDFFTIGFSPLTGRVTLVNDDLLSQAGAYGVDPGKKARFEFGTSLNMNFNKEIVKNVNFKTNLMMFSNYLDHPENIDINWDVFITMKINDFLSANISTNLIYDDDIKITDKNGSIGPRTQFKEVLGIGFTYKFHKYK